MTKAQSALVVASVALSPTCGAALSILPRHQQPPIKANPSGGLFGKRASGSTPRWMLPSLQSSRAILSQLRSTEEKKAEMFFLEEDEISANGDVGHQEPMAIKPHPPITPPAPPVPAEPTFLEKIGKSQFFQQIINPTIARDVPPDTIQGAAINGSFLTLLTSYLLFGPLSIPSLSTLVAAASVGIISAYLSIIEGDAGDLWRGVGRTTSEFTNMVVEQVEQMKGEVNQMKIADALTEKPKATPAAPKKKSPKKKDPVSKKVEAPMPLSEGLTAEEAEEVRTARLVGGSAPSPAKAIQTEVTEGQTADEALEARMAKEKEAKRLAVGKKAAFQRARLETQLKQQAKDAAAGAERAKAEAEAMKKAEADAKAAEEERLADMAAALAKEAEEKRLAEEKVAAEAAAEAARLAKEAEEQRLAEEAAAKAAAEDARLRAEEEARMEAEALKMEEARLAKLAEEEEQRRLEEQAEAAREAVRLMEEQDALMDDEDEDDLEEDELDDEEWEASVRLANELQGMPTIGGDVIDDISDDLLQAEINNLTPEEEDALGKAAREAVKKYEEEMAMKASQKKTVRSSWDDEMVAPPPMQPSVTQEAAVINGAEEAADSADVDYSKMTVVQLKDMLRSKGLKVSGKKAELIQRLESS